MWRTTFRGLMANKLKLGLTALSIVFGVGFVAGTYVLTDTMQRTFDNLVTEGVGGTDVFVRSEAAFVDLQAQPGAEREPLGEELLPIVRGIDGVRVAGGTVQGYAQLIDKEGKSIAPVGPPTIGTSWPIDPALSPYTVRDGRPPQAEKEVAVDAGTAEQNGFHVGDSVQVQFLGPSERFDIVGIVGYGEADNLAGATLAVFEIETAQRVLGKEGQLDAIDIVAEDGVSPDDLRDRIAEVLPAGIQAITGASLRDEFISNIRQAVGFIQTPLLIFAIVSVFVGAFIIFNTFNILITQRTRELALLRALGAGSGQVLRSVLLESLIVGTLASAVGLGVGVLIALGLQAAMAAVGFDLPTSGLVLLTRTIVVSLILGIGVTILSAIVPARRAARLSPMAALREMDVVRPTSLRARSAIAAAAAFLGVGVLAAGLFADGGIGMVGAGMALIFVGVTVAAPLLVTPVARFIGSPIARLRGVPGRLGRENAMRNPRRTASTSAALMIGLALVGMFAILGQSVKASLAEVIEGSYRADFILAPTSQLASFSPEVADRLRELDEVGVVSETRIGAWRAMGGQSSSFLSGVDPATIERVLNLGVTEGDLADLGTRGVALHQTEADERGLEIGDGLRMRFAATGAVGMRLTAIFEESTEIGDTLISLAAHEANYPSSGNARVFVVRAAAVSEADARSAIEAELEGFPNVEVRNPAEVQANQEEQIDQLLGLISTLLALAVIIALIGIINTLALSVLERTRELGLLRAVGMGRRQMRSMVRWESVIIALIGGLLGLGVGIFFGWILVAALEDEGLRTLALPGTQLLLFLVFAGLAGVLAAIGPARRAAKMDVLRAVTVE
ncbi:MAG: ABC transporter permease [Actinomycetota bacterium]